MQWMRISNSIWTYEWLVLYVSFASLRIMIYSSQFSFVLSDIIYDFSPTDITQSRSHHNKFFFISILP